MSAKNKILKKVHRDIRRAKSNMVYEIAREILTQPLKERIKLAFKIIFKGKL